MLIHVLVLPFLSGVAVIPSLEKGTLEGDVVDFDGDGTSEVVIVAKENNGHDIFISLRFIKVIITSVAGTATALVGAYLWF